MKKLVGVSTLILALFLSACSSSVSDIEKERAAILSNNSSILAAVYKEKPDVKAQVEAAPGYATFDNTSLMIGFGGGAGKGVLVNNKTQKRTFMNMAEVKAGVGLGVKNFRVLFVFHDEKTLNNFIEHGWAAGASASADAVADDKGASKSGDVKINNITVYQLTDTGLALEASLSGTKYWVSNKLN